MRALICSFASSSFSAFSRISSSTLRRTLSARISLQSKSTYSDKYTILFENTLTSRSSIFNITSLTPASSISCAISLETASPALAKISPVRGSTTSAASVLPEMRADIASFLLYLYRPTRAKSYLRGSKSILFIIDSHFPH